MKLVPAVSPEGEALMCPYTHREAKPQPATYGVTLPGQDDIQIACLYHLGIAVEAVRPYDDGAPATGTFELHISPYGRWKLVIPAARARRRNGGQ